MEVASVSNTPLPAPSCFPPHYRPPSAPTWLPGLPTSTAPPASNIPPVCAGGSSAAGHPAGEEREWEGRLKRETEEKALEWRNRPSSAGDPKALRTNHNAPLLPVWKQPPSPPPIHT